MSPNILVPCVCLPLHFMSIKVYPVVLKSSVYPFISVDLDKSHSEVGACDAVFYNIGDFI